MYLIIALTRIAIFVFISYFLNNFIITIPLHIYIYIYIYIYLFIKNWVAIF